MKHRKGNRNEQEKHIARITELNSGTMIPTLKKEIPTHDSQQQ